MFEHKLNTEYLKLSKIAYGGELYFELNNYKLKEISVNNSYIKRITDAVINNEHFFSYKNEESGFCANVFENIKTKDLVIAYRGTERIDFGENNSDFRVWGKDISTDINLITGIIDAQFNDAWNFYNLVKEQNPKSQIILTGHSLGGALAQLTAAKAFSETHRNWFSQKPKTYTYNAPGCKHLLKPFNCLENYNYSFIMNYAVMNDWCGMFGENIGETYVIAPILLNELTTNSILGTLNNILLTTHEGIFDYSEKTNGKIIRKPDNFNQDEGLALWYYDKNNTLKSVQALKDTLDNLKSKFHISTAIEIGRVIKEDTQKFIEEHKPEFLDVELNVLPNLTEPLKEKMKEKLFDNSNYEIFKSLTALIDKTIENVTINNLQTALEILNKKKILNINKDYIENLQSYVISKF